MRFPTRGTLLHVVGCFESALFDIPFDTWHLARTWSAQSKQLAIVNLSEPSQHLNYFDSPQPHRDGLTDVYFENFPNNVGISPSLCKVPTREG